MSPEHAKALARVGRVLKGKYTLDRLLGEGGMGAVYAATHRNGLQVAIKMLHPSLSADDTVRARFLREGYAANKVKHSSVVTVLDDEIDEEEGTAFLVLELLEGETAESYVKRSGGIMPVEQALVLADRVLDVLAAAHSQGVVHRDIKPDNLFLTRDGGLKVFDFGIARLLEQSQHAQAATRTGAFLGTPAFMAPEQARGRSEQIDARTDLWALGATLFTLLSNRPVHEADTVNELLLAAMTRAPLPLAQVASHVPLAVAAIVDRALAFDRDQRWSDARAMQQAIRALLPAQLIAPVGVTGTLPGFSPQVTHAMAPDQKALHAHLTTSRGVAAQPGSARASAQRWSLAKTLLAAGSAFALGAAAILWFVLSQSSVVSPGTLVQTSTGSSPDPSTLILLPSEPFETPASEGDSGHMTRGKGTAAAGSGHANLHHDAGITILPPVTAVLPPPTSPPAVTVPPAPPPTSTGVDWDKRK
jgi:serine/threonine-protein kinase